MGWVRGVVATSWLVAGLAVAQNGAALQTPAPNPEAVQLFRTAMGKYKAGQFSAAIPEFKAADALGPSPSLSYDIAQCYEKLGDLRNARHYFEEYLTRAPRAEDRTTVEAELASLDAQILASEKKAHIPVAAPLVVTEQVATPTPGPNRIPSYILMGLGAVGLGVAIGLNVASSSNANSLVTSAVPMASPAISARQVSYDSAQGMFTGALVGYIAGGAILATGAIIFLVQSAGHSTAAPAEDVP